MSRYASILLLPLAFALAVSCDDGQSPSPPPDYTSHEFEWRIDTIVTQDNAIEYFYSCMWGTSPDNIYVGGHSDATRELLSHWDGKKWSFINLGPYGLNNTIVGIDGLDSSFFVVLSEDPVGDPMVIYENGKWNKVPQHHIFQTHNTLLKVVSRTEIYVAGEDGIAVYDGTKWTVLLDSSETQGWGLFEFQPTSIVKWNGRLFMISTSELPGQNRKLNFWEFTNSLFRLRDSTEYDYSGSNDATFGTRMFITGGRLFCGGRKVFEYKNERWEAVFGNGGFMLTGNPNNLYLGSSWAVSHYNGQDWEELTPPEVFFGPGGRSIESILYSHPYIILSVHTQGGKAYMYWGKQKEE